MSGKKPSKSLKPPMGNVSHRLVIVNSGSGNCTVNYSVTAHMGSCSINDSITVAGNTFNVTQAGTNGNCLANSPWPKFRGNPFSAGLSTADTSVDTGTLKWSYTTWNGTTYNMSLIYSSPAIGADGIIYVGSDDGVFLRYTDK